MAYTGQVIENPVSGEQIVFRKTAAETAGEYLEIELRLAADGKVPGMHVLCAARAARWGRPRSLSRLTR